MNLVERAQAILLKPKQTWPVIADEPATTASIYTNWLIYLAAIPAVAGFIGLSLIGVGAFGVSVRIPVLAGLTQAVVGYALSLAAVFIVALIVDALAPSFGGTKNPLNALKLVAFGSTAGFLGGIFSLLPSLSILGLLAALYSIYLLYTGVPVLMKSPPEKATAYTAVIVVCSIVAMIVLGALTALFVPRGAMGLAGTTGDQGTVTIRTPGGEVRIDSSKMDQAARAAEEAGKRLEAAQKAGDPASAGKALGDVLSAVTGGLAGGSAAAIASADLKALLPETLGGMKRESVESQGGQAMGIAGSSAKASYVKGDQQLRLSITDLGCLGGLAAVAGWANMTMDRETADSIEKVYKLGGRTIREEYRKDGSRGEYTLILANGVIVEAEGDKIDIATLKSMAGLVDLARLEALKRAAR